MNLKILISGKGCLPRILHSCFLGSGETGLLDSPHYVTSHGHGQRTLAQEALLLLYCFSGLQASYLLWGYLQEKIMTQVCSSLKKDKQLEIQKL